MTNPPPRSLVLDTNIVLDAFVFNDAAAQPVCAGLASRALHWLATQAMRDELERVLAYPKIAPRLAYYGIHATHVLERFDGHVRLVPEGPKADVTCKDPDDQKFIDLAVAHQALLLSKDQAVLCMARRLAVRGVVVQRTLTPAA